VCVIVFAFTYLCVFLGSPQATFGPSLSTLSVASGLSVVAAEPLLADAPLTNAAAVAGNIVVVRRGGASFATKVSHVAAAGTSPSPSAVRITHG
jgi:hypothetical protein